MTNMTQTQAWQDLISHYNHSKNFQMRDLFSKEPDRFANLSLQGPHIFLDYSKNRITQTTIDLLAKLAEAMHLEEKIEAMFNGYPINLTEYRAVLHTALRNRSNNPIMVDDLDVMPQINDVLDKIRTFTEKVRSGQWKGFTGKTITDIVNIGIGGSDLGPKMVSAALEVYSHDNLQGHFVSNIDGSQLVETLKLLNPETTLFVIASKTFTTLETLTNAETARSWLVDKLGDANAVAKHFVAVSTNKQHVEAFGIDPNNMFEFWDWVGGRYSVWSAIGLSMILLIGMDNFEELLTGAYEMDEHFRQTPFHKNLPVILAMLGIWYRNFYNTTSQAIIPYDHYLGYFPDYLQQLDMESNGKSRQIDGQTTEYKTGPVIWGSTGTDSQHSFHQLLHQGTDIIPIDFIIAVNSLNPIGKHQELLFANCLAQSQALLKGKTYDEAYIELINKGFNEAEAQKLAPHKVMPGNRPSNTLILERLTPKSLGALIALYEHKVFVQGVIWNINSFDQWGVELGKALATNIGPYLTDPEKKAVFDSSTQGLINYFQKVFI